MGENFGSFGSREGEKSDFEGKLNERAEALRKYFLSEIFDSCKTGQERVEKLFLRLKPILDSKFIDGENIKEALGGCVEINDKSEFIERVFIVLKPVYDFGDNNPDEMSELTDSGIETIKINEVLHYNIENNEVNIHLSPTGLETFEIKKLYFKGLAELDKIINENKGIDTVIASSWIVEKNPGLIEGLGFAIDDKIKGVATMSREDFLNRYLKD